MRAAAGKAALMGDRDYLARITAYEASARSQGWVLSANGRAPLGPPKLPMVQSITTEILPKDAGVPGAPQIVSVTVLAGTEGQLPHTQFGGSNLSGQMLRREEVQAWTPQLGPARWIRLIGNVLIRSNTGDPNGASWLGLRQRPNLAGRDEDGDGRQFEVSLHVSRPMIEVLSALVPVHAQPWKAARRLVMVLPLPYDICADDTPLGSSLPWFPTAKRLLDQLVLAHTDVNSPDPAPIVGYCVLKERFEPE